MTSEQSVKVPDGWKYVTIGSLMKESKNGFASGERDENGIIQLRMNNVTTDGNIIFDKYLKVPIPHNIDSFILMEGDFLFNNTNSIDLVGKSAIYKEQKFKCTYSNHFTRIRFDNEKVVPELVLYHTLKLWRTGTLRRFAIRHVGQAAIHHSYLLKRKILLPPLPEQHKIASILSKVDEHISHTEAIIEKTEELKKGLMQQLLTKGIGHTKFKKTEIGEIPEEWDVKEIHEICEVKTGGTPSTKRKEYWNGDILWMSSGEINNHFIYATEKRITVEGMNNSNARILPANSVMIALNGQGKTRGTVAVLKVPSTCNQSLACIIPDGEACDYLYLYYNLQSRYLEIRNYTGNTGREGLNLGIIRDVNVPLPTLSEQQKIASILYGVDDQLSQNQTYLSHLQELKKGLMQDLLTGKVRVKIGTYH